MYNSTAMSVHVYSSPNLRVFRAAVVSPVRLSLLQNFSTKTSDDDNHEMLVSGADLSLPHRSTAADISSAEVRRSLRIEQKVSHRRSRKERSDSVTSKILQERISHMERIDAAPGNPVLEAELKALHLGRRKQPSDSALFATKFIDDKKAANGVGAGGFATRLGSATKDWPCFKHRLPEIALAGHTNAGKSTLINALAGIHPKKGPAGVSERAGWTDFISFYQIGKKPPILILVDLPGYGHAVANRSMQREWNRMIRDYLAKSRKQLCRCCVLVDATRGFASEDMVLIDYLEKATIEYQIVLTMGDLLSPGQLARSMHLVQRDLDAKDRKHLASQPIVPVSGHTGAGVTNLWEQLKTRSLAEPGSLFARQMSQTIRREPRGN